MNKNRIVRFLNIIVGLTISSTAFNLFFMQNNLAAYGVSGLSIIISKTSSIDASIFILVANAILLIFSFFLLGKRFTKNAILGSFLYPIFIKLTSFIPQYIDISGTETILIAVLGGIMVGYGSGFIYRSGFNTGGTDIVDFIISKYLKIPLGTSILIGDGTVVLIGGLVFGIEAMIYSIIVLFFYSVISNKILVGIGNSKTLYIMSKEAEIIKEMIKNNYIYDVTVLNAEGIFNKKAKVILCSVLNKDYYKISKEIKKIDSKVFMTVTPSYEVLNSKLTKKA